MAAAPPPAPAAGGDLIKIADLKPWMRNVNCQFIVLNKCNFFLPLSPPSSLFPSCALSLCSRPIKYNAGWQCRAPPACGRCKRVDQYESMGRVWRRAARRRHYPSNEWVRFSSLFGLSSEKNFFKCFDTGRPISIKIPSICTWARLVK